MSRKSRRDIGSPETAADQHIDIPSASDESGLARWSRRKAASRQRTSIHAEDISDESVPKRVQSGEPGDEAIEYPTDQDMPPLESLDEHSDYSGFFSPKVSEKLRKQALRKLFHLDLYNVTDGLDDYAEDYTKFAPLGNILTADMRLQQQRADNSARAESDNTITQENEESGKTGRNDLAEFDLIPSDEAAENKIEEEGVDIDNPVTRDQG